MITAWTVADGVVAYRGDHMSDNEWMWVFGPLMMAVWLVLLAVLVWWIVTFANRKNRSTKESPPTDQVTPEEILAGRFARGEIGATEYREALEHLRARHGNTP